MEPMTFADPAAAGRKAQLLLALLLLSILPMCLLTLPIPTHAVKLDLPRLPNAIVRLPPVRPDAWVLTTLVAPGMALEAPRPVHQLVVTRNGEIRLNGRGTDLRGLSERLALIMMREEPVDLRPHPEARYERVAQVLAVTGRSHVARLRLDSGPFEDTLPR